MGELVIDKSEPWELFDKTTQGLPEVTGAKEILFLSSNNYAKLMALWFYLNVFKKEYQTHSNI
jgi:hypothetical protein